jgi:hypothetical protein
MKVVSTRVFRPKHHQEQKLAPDIDWEELVVGEVRSSTTYIYRERCMMQETDFIAKLVHANIASS